MKRFLAVCLSALMILAFVPVATLPAAAVDGKVAYLGSTTGDDSTGELGNSTKPFQTIVAAINALGNEGGTVQFVEAYDYSSSAKANVHYGLVTIDGGGYEMGINLTSNCFFKCTGPTYFKNIVFTPKQNVSATKNFNFLANYWPLTMGEGISCTETVSGATPNFSVIGGSLNQWAGLETCVTVKSGTWRAVCAGTRGTSAETRRSANGHLQLFFEGGTVGYLFAGNWDETSTTLDYGGYCTCYISGGTVSNITYLGGQNLNQQAATSLLVYTGGQLNPTNGTKVGIENSYVDGSSYIIYGGNVSKRIGDPCQSIGGSGAARTSDLFQDDGGAKYVDFTYRNSKYTNFMPLRTGADTTVYVDYENGSLYGAGTESDPVKTLTAAYGMLTYTGGEIILMSDYKLEGEETDRFYQFYEPFHEAEIVVNGEYNSVKHKITGDEKFSDSKTVNGNTYTVSEGFVSWVLNGDTTFENVEFCNNRHRFVQANYHVLTMGDGVDITTEGGGSSNSSMTVCGARYIFAEENSYTSDFDFCYRIFKDTDVDMSLLSGTYTVYPFSYYIVEQNKASTVEHTGTASITVGGSAYIKSLNTYDYTVTSSGIYNYAPDVEVYIRNTYASDKPYIESISLKSHPDRTFQNNHDSNVKEYGTEYQGNVVNIHADNPVAAGVAGKYGIRIGFDNIEVARNCYVAWDLSGAYDEPVELRLESLTKGGVSLRDDGDGTYSMRSLHNINVARCVDMANFPVVEFGVLIMRSDNDNAMTYIRGADAFSELPLLYGEDTGSNNYSSVRKIGKSIAFIRNTDYSSGRVNNYNYDGTSDTASFYGVVSGISLANKDAQLSFRPYAVYADTTDPSNIKYMTFYGLLANASLLDVANAIAADENASAADKAIAQTIIDG